MTEQREVLAQLRSGWLQPYRVRQAPRDDGGAVVQAERHEAAEREAKRNEDVMAWRRERDEEMNTLRNQLAALRADCQALAAELKAARAFNENIVRDKEAYDRVYRSPAANGH